MQSVGFAMYKEMPFSTYGESAIVGVQNLIMVLLVWAYNETIKSSEKVSVVVALVVYG